MAERWDEPQRKKSRHDTIFNKFHSSADKSFLCKSFRQLCDDRINSLVSLEISYCDAAAEFGKPFSRATCHGKPVIKELYPFASIFLRGVRTLKSILKDDYHTPCNEEDVGQKLLTPLLKYLFDEKSQECLIANHSDENETQVMIRLATHYFSKLSVSKSFIMDKNASDKGRKCSCWNSENDFLDYFGDTSIGKSDLILIAALFLE
ncbi:uncharacterized protein LOC132720815 [Ruditapes philippinarum]|uniref:uncharacterized protein LOC132720815 n=1 Tax=Ruditapes philippinarum TaxID=129788 RepID=UPI00295B1B1A|nr:uncharacterized protein LOC132720815 [Ruditapes philippinarum]